VIAALPFIPGVGCGVIPGLSLACGAASGVTASILGAGASDLLGVLASGVAQGASWLLSAVGSVIGSTTSVDLGASWFKSHYEVMVGLAAVVLVPLLAASVVQSIYRQSPSALLRAALVHLPLALLVGAVAVQLVQLSLAACDALASAVSSGSSGSIGSALSAVASSLADQAAGTGAGVPTFVALLGALFVALGALVLWVELLVRSAAVYAATLFFPLALASLVWPAVSHWCRRLVETVAALVLSKFVIVAVLSLAAGAVGSGGSIATELAGGALLLLAAFAPFTLLRLVPMVEASAAHHLEEVRHRAQRAAVMGGRTGVALVVGQLGPPPLPELPVGTGAAAPLELPGPEPPSSEGGGAPGGGGSSPATPPGDAVGTWPGIPAPAPVVERERPSGPPPVWGATLPALGPPPARIGDHELVSDHLGPVLRWRPDPEPGGGRHGH